MIKAGERREKVVGAAGEIPLEKGWLNFTQMLACVARTFAITLSFSPPSRALCECARVSASEL